MWTTPFGDATGCHRSPCIYADMGRRGDLLSCVTNGEARGPLILRDVQAGNRGRYSAPTRAKGILQHPWQKGIYECYNPECFVVSGGILRKPPLRDARIRPASMKGLKRAGGRQKGLLEEFLVAAHITRLPLSGCPWIQEKKDLWESLGDQWGIIH